jgi:2,4-diketo-3-deoxy-L-fuconate hydrolase
MKKLPMLAMFASLLGACTTSWNTAFDERFPEADRGTVEIAAVSEALTLARAEVAGVKRVFAVTGYRGGEVTSVDLSGLLDRDVIDPAALFAELGYETLRDRIASAPEKFHLTVLADRLVRPLDFDDRHIAVGTNYPEHASDAGTTTPFLFPKIVEPGTSGDDVSTRGSLLDYEVEIAAVPLEPLTAGAPPRFLGLVLANDFTDRGLLLHLVDRDDIESGKGFTTGKGFPGALPVGNLLVIPRDWRTFVPGLELRLFVNDRLRQRSRASEMVWDTAQVFERIFAKKGVTWEHEGGAVALFDGDAIAARTLVLTGTPHGTVFDGVPRGVMARGLLRWLAGGWSKSIPEQVIDAYVEAAREAKAYLQPGDRVAIHVHRLGELKSRVVP